MKFLLATIATALLLTSCSSIEKATEKYKTPVDTTTAVPVTAPAKTEKKEEAVVVAKKKKKKSKKTAATTTTDTTKK